MRWNCRFLGRAGAAVTIGALLLAGARGTIWIAGQTVAAAADPPTTIALPPGTYGNVELFGPTFGVASDSTVTVDLVGGSGQAGCLKLYVDAALVVDQNDFGIPGCHGIGPGPSSWSWTIPLTTGGLAHLALENMGNLSLTSGTVAYTAAPPWAPPPGTSSFALASGIYGNTPALGQAFPVAAGWTVTVHLDAVAGPPGCLKLYVDGSLVTDRADYGIAGCHGFDGGPRYWDWSIPVTAGGTAQLALENMGSLTLADGAVAYGPK